MWKVLGHPEHGESITQHPDNEYCWVIAAIQLPVARKSQQSLFCRFQRSLSLPDTLIYEASYIRAVRQYILITVTNSVGIPSCHSPRKVMQFLVSSLCG